MSVLDNVENKIHRLLVLYDGLRSENIALIQKMAILEKELADTQKRLKDCEKKLSDLTYVKAMQVTEDEAVRMRNRMLKLEREVEKCISLLNE